jgi:hypothetical protein
MMDMATGIMLLEALQLSNCRAAVYPTDFKTPRG